MRMHGGRERQHKPWVRQNAREEKRRQDDFRGHGSGQNGYDKYRSDDEGADWIMRVMRYQRSEGTTTGTNTNGVRLGSNVF